MGSNQWLVVLDFDGTFTDVEVEGRPFTEKYLEVLREFFGQDVSGLWNEEAGKLSAPDAAWVVGGHAVAPASCDPYIRATCIAHHVCARLGRFADVTLRTELLQAVYGYCYRFAGQAFRPDAQEALKRMLAATSHVFVVSNSETSAVQKKLASIGFPQLPVFGNARKYVVDQVDPRTVALEDIRVSGQSRPMLVRRPHYARVLSELWDKTGLTATSTLVCGDIFELDLALPLRLGTRAHLVERPNTLDSERAAIALFPGRATAGPTLGEAAALVERLTQA